MVPGAIGRWGSSGFPAATAFPGASLPREFTSGPPASVQAKATRGPQRRAQARSSVQTHPRGVESIRAGCHTLRLAASGALREREATCPCRWAGRYVFGRTGSRAIFWLQDNCQQIEANTPRVANLATPYMCLEQHDRITSPTARSKKESSPSSGAQCSA